MKNNKKSFQTNQKMGSKMFLKKYEKTERAEV